VNEWGGLLGETRKTRSRITVGVAQSRFFPARRPGAPNIGLDFVHVIDFNKIFLQYRIFTTVLTLRVF
jgi:hypothetical protein